MKMQTTPLQLIERSNVPDEFEKYLPKSVQKETCNDFTMNPMQPRKKKKSRTANSIYFTLKTLTHMIANVYAGLNRKGDTRKKWLRNIGFMRTVSYLTPRVGTLGSALTSPASRRVCPEPPARSVQMHIKCKLFHLVRLHMSG